MITVQEVKDAIRRLSEVRNELERIEATMKPLKEEKDGLQAKITLMLNEINETSFKTEYGTVSKVTEFTVKLPDGEAKQEFFNYLKERGVFDVMATINYQTLNAYFKEQRELAIEEGDELAALNFSLPGIGEAKSFETIRFRKK